MRDSWKHKPQRGTYYKAQAPSQLADLDGRRKPGGEVRMASGQDKAPKQRFSPGDLFEFDGGFWEIICMYRLAREPGVWRHLLECISEKKSDDARFIENAFMALGAGATTPRIVFEPFAYDGEASTFFRDICCRGDRVVKTTQGLLKLKKLKPLTPPEEG